MRICFEGAARSNSEAEKLFSLSDGESRWDVLEMLRSWPWMKWGCVIPLTSVVSDRSSGPPSSRPNAARVSRLLRLSESYTARFRWDMCAVVMVSAFAITGMTVVLPCSVRRTCKSNFSSSAPVLEAGLRVKNELPFEEFAFRVLAIFVSRRAGSSSRNAQ